MYMKNFLLLVFLVFSIPALAATEPELKSEATLAGIDLHKVEKMLAKHFSMADIESLKAYMKGAMLGVPTPMAPELKAKVRDFMTEMRLEYGFQFAVLMAELKKKIFRVLPPDLAELAEEFTQKLKAELDE
jgi:uncharacterized protein (DUF2267 family)